MNYADAKTSLVVLALVVSCLTLTVTGDVGAAPTHRDHSSQASQFNLDAVLAQAGGGSIAPTRMIYDPYPTFAQIAVDPKNNMVVLADNSSASLLVYDMNKTAVNQAGITPYVARLKGEATHVDSPIGVALDTKARRIYFSDNDIAETLGSFPYGANGNYPASTLAIHVGGSGLGLSLRLQQKALAEEDLGIIMIFRLGATGGEPPLREIRGIHTQIADPRGLYWDDVNHEIAIANDGNWNPGYWDADYTGGGHFYPASIVTFDDSVKGDAHPKRVLQGPNTQLNWPFQVAVDPAHNEIAVANLGGNSVLIFKRTASGNVAPIRVLSGPHTGIDTPTGVAFDDLHDELWVADYGHQVMAFPRTADGDASPTHIIRSAPAGSAVVGVSLPYNLTYDARRDEWLVKNCNTDSRIGVFARMANGAARPLRIIHGQKTKLTKTGHGIAYSLARDEIFTSSASAGAITVYRGDADGDVSPIRIVQGPKSRLVAPWAITVDDPHHEMTVIDNTIHTVSTFPIDANGDVAPIRVLAGPHTLLGTASSRYSGAIGLGEDPEHNLIVVSTHTRGIDPGWPYGGLLIFDRTATGDTPPRAIIAGPHTGIKDAGNLVIANGKIFVNVGNRGWTPSYGAGGFAPRKGCNGPPPDILVVGSATGFIGVWDEQQKGDVPPLYTIHGVTAQYINLGGITVDPKDGEVSITDGGHDGVLTYLVPSFFQAGPVTTLSER